MKTWLVLAGCLTLLGAPTEARAEESSREGWHGERMPEGLRRAEKEGEYVWEKDDSVMVWIPPGKFLMGSEDGDPDEKPVREVWLDGFYIDKYEVTWRQWRLSGLPLPEDRDGGPLHPQNPIWGRHDNLPVTYMEWFHAKAYVEWVGKRLPTEAEWEKAARGTDGRVYPWGNDEPDFDRAVWQDHPVGKESPAPVDCCAKGASPYGVFNMAGNVFEWCEDFYDSKFYSRAPERNPVNLEPGRRRVVRGGAFVLETEDLRTSLRNRLYPEEGQDYVGFRAVLSPGSAPRIP